MHFRFGNDPPRGKRGKEKEKITKKEEGIENINSFPYK